MPTELSHLVVTQFHEIFKILLFPGHQASSCCSRCSGPNKESDSAHVAAQLIKRMNQYAQSVRWGGDKHVKKSQSELKKKAPKG